MASQQYIYSDGGQQSQYGYDYNPYNIQYQEMSISNWNSVTVDQTDYSQYWASTDAFEPETFAENTKKEKKWNDVGYMIAFIINVLATIGLFIFLIWKSENLNSDSGKTLDDELESKELWVPALVGLAISIVLNVLHFIYILFAPVFYVKFGMFVWVVSSIVVAIVSYILYPVWYFFIFPVFSILMSLCYYFCARPYFAMSAAILKTSVRIIFQNWTFIFVSILWSFFGEVVSFIYSWMIYLNEYTGISNWVYIYIVFSYVWVLLTLGYVMYMTGAGVAATWYFLNDTENYPKNPVWESFRRATTISFGSACAASLFLAIVQALKTLIEMDSDSDSVLVVVLKCIALCLLSCIECFIKYMNRYALIYCATFGVPYKEGCRRWAELSCKKFCNLIMGGNIIGDSIASNLIVFCLGAALLGYGFGCLIDNDSYYIPIFACVFSLLFTMMFFVLITDSVEVIGDTLIICFSESPENLKTSAYELEEELESCYRKFLGIKHSKKSNN